MGLSPGAGLRTWPRAFWQWQERNEAWLTRAATLIGALAVVFHFSTFAGLLFDYSDSIGVVSAFDNDSAYGIETSQRTWLINHNGSPMYGPVYYRIGAVFRTLLDNDYGRSDLTPSQLRERSVFFHMMLINLIALYAGAFLLMWSLTESRFFQLIGTVVLVAAILRDEWRSQLLFMVKPEHLFAAIMMGVGLLIFRRLARETVPGIAREDRGFAAGWALAASTKLSVIFFLPGLVSLWFPWGKDERGRFFSFVKWTIIFYLLIGFPQNLDVAGYLKYLLQQSGHSSFVSWSFLSQDWLPLFLNDFGVPALFLLGMFFWVPVREEPIFALSGRAFARFGIFLALSLAFLFSKELRVPHEWYSFPMVNLCWLLLVFLLATATAVAVRASSRVRTLADWRHHALYPFLVLAVLPFILDAFPSRVEAAFRAGMHCRTEIRRVQARIDGLASGGKRLLVDPYVPADFKISRELRTVKGTWRMDWAEIADFRADVLAFRRSFGEGLLADPALPAASREVYSAFLGAGGEVVTTEGIVWRRTHVDECGFSIWEK